MEQEKSEEKKEEAPEEIKDDKTNRNFAMIAAAIIIISVGFFAIQHFYEPEEPELLTVEYNGFEFLYSENLWHTQWQQDGYLYNIRLHFNPREVENVSLTGDLNETFTDAQQVYITFDPEEEPLNYVALTAAELSFALTNVLEVEPIAACAENVTEACSARPIVTCDDSDKAVIYLKVDDETGIEMNGNCVVVKGKDMEIVRAAEKAVYKWYRIIR